MFNALKDSMSSKAAQVFINKQIARYGRVTDLKIDSAEKTLELTCELDGEDRPVTVRVGRYVIEEVGDKRFIKAKSFSCSRPWLKNALDDFAKDRRVELPPWAAGAL